MDPLVGLVQPTSLVEAELLIATFVLCSLIGLERQMRQKSAGYRTHVLVGLGSCAFTLVSAYGFAAVLGEDVNLDPSRIAAQIVSGIGFLGAGVIFVRQNVVNGLTTAASIWVTAAIGMACGAGLPVIAAVTTLLYLLAVTTLSYVASKVSTSRRETTFVIRYRNNKGALRRILTSATALGYQTALGDTRKIELDKGDMVEAEMRFTRATRGPTDDLIEAFNDLKDVFSVHTPDENN